MAQTSDSLPTHPVIVFQVNLETVNRVGHSVPNRIETTGNESTSEADQMRNTRSIFLPGLLNGENQKLKHGDQFTLKGLKALYYKNLYVSTPASSSDTLTIVSET